MNRLFYTALCAGTALATFSGAAFAQSSDNQQMYNPNYMRVPDQQAAGRFTYDTSENPPNRNGTVGSYPRGYPMGMPQGSMGYQGGGPEYGNYPPMNDASSYGPAGQGYDRDGSGMYNAGRGAYDMTPDYSSPSSTGMSGGGRYQLAQQNSSQVRDALRQLRRSIGSQDQHSADQALNQLEDNLGYGRQMRVEDQLDRLDQALSNQDSQGAKQALSSIREALGMDGGANQQMVSSQGTNQQGVMSESSGSGPSKSERGALIRALQQMGLKNVKVLDAKYLLQATTPEGRQVVMIADPPTQMGQGGSGGGSANSSGSKSSGSSGSSGSSATGAGASGSTESMGPSDSSSSSDGSTGQSINSSQTGAGAASSTSGVTAAKSRNPPSTGSSSGDKNPSGGSSSGSSNTESSESSANDASTQSQ